MIEFETQTDHPLIMRKGTYFDIMFDHTETFICTAGVHTLPAKGPSDALGCHLFNSAFVTKT